LGYIINLCSSSPVTDTIHFMYRLNLSTDIKGGVRFGHIYSGGLARIGGASKSLLFWWICEDIGSLVDLHNGLYYISISINDKIILTFVLTAFYIISFMICSLWKRPRQ